ncbi:MAG: type 4a pilus biogenesis protein PilO [Thermodesulfobacteriota bacterium]
MSDWLDNKSLTTKLSLLIGIIIIISAAYWYFFWSPNNKNLVSLNQTLTTKKTKLAELENIARELPKFEAEFKRLQKEFEVSSLKLPKDEEIPALIDSVYSEVSASGLEPVVFSKKAQISKDIYAEIPIDMKVSGSFFELATFFDKVSRLPRIVNIRDIDLTQGANRGKDLADEGELSAGFTAVTFRLLPAPAKDEQSGTDKLKR